MTKPKSPKVIVPDAPKHMMPIPSTRKEFEDQGMVYSSSKSKICVVCGTPVAPGETCPVDGMVAA